MAFKMSGFSGFKQRRNKKNKETEVDYNLPYEGAEGTSISRSTADKMYDSEVTPEERELGSKLTQDTEGNYTRRTKLSSPALPQRKIYSSGAPINPDYPHAVRSKKTGNTTGPGKGPDDGPHPDRISNKNNPEEFKGAIKEMDKFLNPKNSLDHIFNK